MLSELVNSSFSTLCNIYNIIIKALEGWAENINSTSTKSSYIINLCENLLALIVMRVNKY